MSKPKQGPALFDLIPGKNAPESRILRMPGGWPGEEKAVESPELEPATEAASTPETAVAGPAGGFWGTTVRLDGQRITLSMTSYGAAIALFLVVVVLSAAFTLGQRSGVRSGYQLAVEQVPASSTGNELEVARLSPPVPGLIDPLLESPSPVAEPVQLAGKAALEQPAGGVRWQRDYTYVLAQEFPAGRGQDAASAQAFLQKHGIDATVVPQANGGAWLLTQQGYNHKDPLQRKQGDQLLERVRSVGKAYYAQGGGYKLEGYFRTLKGDRW